MVGQVIVNLLKNALSASSAAGRPGAEVTLTLARNSAEIAVADHGAGVSADAAKTMFQPFSKSARGGMGLGLAICQRIAAALGGSLSWENRAHGGADLQVHRSTCKGRQNTVMTSTIMIVDDDRGFAQSLASMLAGSGYRTCVSHDPAGALIHARSQRVDCALIDLTSAPRWAPR